RDGSGSVVSSVGAVDAGRAAKLSDHHDHSLVPGGAGRLFGGRNRAIQHTQEISERARCCTFVDVRIPADEAQGANAWTIRLCEIFRGSARYVGGVFAQAGNSHGDGPILQRLNRVHAAGAGQGDQILATFECDRELRVDLAIEVE